MKKLNYLDSLINTETSRVELLKTVVLTDDIFIKIINSNLSNVEITYFSSNISLNQKNIDKLFDLNIENANINLLKHSHCSEDKLCSFLTLNDKIYNIAIAHNLNLKQSHINTLLKFNDKDVTMSLEFNNYL